MIGKILQAIILQSGSSGAGAGAGAVVAGMSPFGEASVAVAVVAGLAAGIAFAGKIWNRTRQSAKESPEQAVPMESVESIFQVLGEERNQVANDRLYDALDELEGVYSPDKIDAKLNEAVAEWSRNRPEGAGNPPRHADMVKVLRSAVQEIQESVYRVHFANHYRELVSIEGNHWSQIKDVFIRLQAERPANWQPKGPVEQELNYLDERRAGPEFMDFRGKSPDEIQSLLRSAGNVVIVGEPGSGKSTLLRYLAANCADPDSGSALLPLLLPLRELAKSEDNEWLIAERAAEFSTYKLHHTLPDTFFFHALTEGRCLVWTLRILSGISEGICNTMVQSGGEFLYIGVGGR